MIQNLLCDREDIELKTLKDLFPVIKKEKLKKWHAQDIQLIIKAEAIKWANPLGTTTENENTEENVATSEWIKHFFNLTDEDLK